MATNVKEPVAVAPASSQNSSSKATDSKVADSKTGGPLISHDKLKLLYSTMLQCRLLEEKAQGLRKTARFKGRYYTAAGQEAAFVGAAIDLRPEDAVAPSHLDFIPNFIKGVPLNVLFSQINGRATGPGRFSAQAVYSSTAPTTLAAQLNIGNGIALANKMRKNDNLVVAFFAADAASLDAASLDSLQEALSFAGAQDLPIVFVCQNNLAVSQNNLGVSQNNLGATSRQLQSPTKQLPSPTKIEEINRMAQACGFPGIPVDGQDVVAMYRVAYESMQRARNGGGPTLIEAMTAGNAMPGSDNDPITAMERYLTQRNLFEPAWKQQIKKSFGKELDEAIRVAG
ncbi:MAG TPA: thiamine pyrophosphate-dependent enzyme [Acidobacteriaceae bacterium]|nr:thiamine pyrophosphate-dependent enzyme [Acidobacteriaceae bacterium]